MPLTCEPLRMICTFALRWNYLFHVCSLTGVCDAAILHFPTGHKKCPTKPGYRRTEINRKTGLGTINICSFTS